MQGGNNRPGMSSRDGAALPAVPRGAHSVAAAKSAAATPQPSPSDVHPAFPQKPHWRAGMEEWLEAEKRRASTTANSRSRTARHISRSALLTPLHNIAPQSTAVRTPGNSSRRSKSADPGLMLSNAVQSTDSMPHDRTAWSQTVSHGLLDSGGPISRTKVLPLVPNRADREQVHDFYTELRQATEAGRLKFEEGMHDREQKRQINRANQSQKFSMTGVDLLEPLTHQQFLEQLDQLNMILCSVEDEYDSDELEETRAKMYERRRVSWHFARSTDAREKKIRGSEEQSGNPSDDSRALSSHGSRRNMSSLSSPQSSKDDREKSSASGRRKQGKSISSLDLKSAALKQNADAMKAFVVLDIPPHPSEVDLRGRRNLSTPQNMEALVEIFEEVAGLVPPDKLLMSNCLIGGLGIDLMAPYLK